MLKVVYLFNHSNISHPSLEVVYLFLLKKELQSSILWSILCRFYSLYHFLSLAVTHCHLLSLDVPLAVIRCNARCHSLSLVVPLVVTRCHSLSLVVIRCTSRLSFYKPSKKTVQTYVMNTFEILHKNKLIRLFNYVIFFFFGKN